tara:strand:- start:99558 stop:100592 length:1035 start_codon:yes stop_codon:yes gene_type:complete
MKNIINTRIERIKPLISPDLLIEELPADDGLYEHVANARQQIADVLHGRDDRLLVVVGPCSIHDEEAALEYAARLAVLAESLKDKLLIVMRVYFEKPRTTVGWKGLINDPDLDDSYKINKGLRMARKLLLEINRLGLPAATEFLDTITPQYIADLIAWGAIGARTTESQVHRNLASGLSMPLGFKNATNGDVQIAVDAIQAAASSHQFLSVTEQGIAAIVVTKGNEDCQVILRGGNGGPNYSAEHVAAINEKLLHKKIGAKILIDCSHGNSEKDHAKQKLVVASVCEQTQNPEHNIAGVMIESHLVAGKQALTNASQLVYGQSITDACVDWDETEVLLKQLAGV